MNIVFFFRGTAYPTETKFENVSYEENQPQLVLHIGENTTDHNLSSLLCFIYVSLGPL